MTDELKDLGYKNVFETAKADQQLLKDKLKEGPVIVTLGVILASNPKAISGAGSSSHAMVVKGFSLDGETVIVNDPWTGKELALPKSQFEAMWSKGSRGLYAIRP